MAYCFDHKTNLKPLNLQFRQKTKNFTSKRLVTTWTMPQADFLTIDIRPCAFVHSYSQFCNKCALVFSFFYQSTQKGGEINDFVYILKQLKSCFPLLVGFFSLSPLLWEIRRILSGKKGVNVTIIIQIFGIGTYFSWHKLE